MLGKKVLHNFYWHVSLTAQQPTAVQQIIEQAQRLAGLQADSDYNVVKYDGRSQSLSLLRYADFFTAAFPVLTTSYRIDLASERVEKRNYQGSLNPPILHRKELLLSPQHPENSHYRELTATAEQLGLFDNPIRIGFKQAWENLIAEKGFQLLDGQFLPLANVESFDEQVSNNNTTIARHLTALSRSHLSAPMQCLARHGFLNGEFSVFDYGCGKGDDLRNLAANNIAVSGWDPHYAPELPKQTADIVNLGFVINVIEDYDQRVAALCSAYSLAQKLLVVSAMLLNQNAFKGAAFNDGVLTQRNTFQKYFSQAELNGFLEGSLEVNAIAVAPGIFFIFKDANAEQQFLVNRQRSQRRVLRVLQRPVTTKTSKPSRTEQFAHLLEPLWQQSLELGRLPDKSEITNLPELLQAFGTVSHALRLLQAQHETTPLDSARLARIDDLLTYFALQTVAKRPAYKRLETSLQKDINVFFGDYKNALTRAQAVLFQIGNAELIAAACADASQQGLGYLNADGALHLHSSLVKQLPAVLRLYIGCATLLYGDIEQSDVLKIHSQSGKLSLMRYDDFENKPLPRLLERVKINLRRQTFELYQYGDDYEPPYLYFKSRYINEEFPHYAEQLAFDEQLQDLHVLDGSDHGLKPAEFEKKLARARLQVDGFQLQRRQDIPDLDALCGRYLTYRQLIECGETQQATALANQPKQPDSYNALHDLATQILDPVIDYYGMIRLTYGFCSHELSKYIKTRVAPKLDQHAAHERNSKNNLICPRLGAAVDFIVEDENMREVADWLMANTPVDRLYFYGENRPIHVSYAPEPKGETIDLVMTASGKQVPCRR